jgi:hypothetical protein
MKKKYYYKMVKIWNERYYSSNPFDPKNPYRLEYRIGKITKAKSYTIGLFFFKTKGDAYKFRAQQGNNIRTVLKVEVIGEIKKLGIHIVGGPSSRGKKKYLQELEKKGSLGNSGNSLMEDKTYTAMALKPICQV